MILKFSSDCQEQPELKTTELENGGEGDNVSPHPLSRNFSTTFLIFQETIEIFVISWEISWFLYIGNSVDYFSNVFGPSNARGLDSAHDPASGPWSTYGGSPRPSDTNSSWAGFYLSGSSLHMSVQKLAFMLPAFCPFPIFVLGPRLRAQLHKNVTEHRPWVIRIIL